MAKRSSDAMAAVITVALITGVFGYFIGSLMSESKDLTKQNHILERQVKMLENRLEKCCSGKDGCS